MSILIELHNTQFVMGHWDITIALSPIQGYAQQNGVLNLHNLVIFNLSILPLCLGFLVDTSFCVKWLAKLSIDIHTDILVLVSELVVVVILSEWWSVPTTVGTSLTPIHSR